VQLWCDARQQLGQVIQHYEDQSADEDQYQIKYADGSINAFVIPEVFRQSISPGMGIEIGRRTTFSVGDRVEAQCYADFLVCLDNEDCPKKLQWYENVRVVGNTKPGHYDLQYDDGSASDKDVPALIVRKSQDVEAEPIEVQGELAPSIAPNVSIGTEQSSSMQTDEAPKIAPLQKLSADLESWLSSGFGGTDADAGIQLMLGAIGRTSALRRDIKVEQTSMIQDEGADRTPQRVTGPPDIVDLT
jgi:hypothetical protein